MKSEWLPIESAPKDTPVLIWDTVYQKITVATMDQELEDRNGNTHWYPGYGAEYFPRPSHWMPLPKPPVKS